MLAKELLDDPLHDDEIAAVLLQLAAQLLKKAQAKPANGDGSPDRLLTLDEAAERLKVSRSWLYRRSRKDLPFAVHNGRKLSFSERGIEQYIREKQGQNTT